jgi:hypothetical protein
MMNTCECETTLERAASAAACHECGTACCRSCALEIETQTYCRWCATSLATAA